MTFSRTILLATERGANLGHLGRDLALARAFIRSSHHVVLAVPDLKAARGFLAGEEIELIQAPALRCSTAPRPASLSFADMLLNLGFSDGAALAATVEAWLKVFESVRPDLIVYNNAPVALIAARIAKLPVQLIGSAFEIPPEGTTLPTFRPALKVTGEHLDGIEATLVERINKQFERHAVPVVQRVADLYPAASVCLTTLLELDPFGPRRDVAYVGPVFAQPPQHRVEWGTIGGPRVFVYVRPSVGGCEAMLTALQASSAEVICVIPGCPAEWVRRFDRIRFFMHPLVLALLLPEAQLVVTCGVGLLCTALLSGLPVLFMPQTVEQRLVSQVTLRTGAVTLFPESNLPADVDQALAAALGAPVLRDSALSFAVQYLAIHFEDNAESIVSKAASLIGSD